MTIAYTVYFDQRAKSLILEAEKEGDELIQLAQKHGEQSKVEASKEAAALVREATSIGKNATEEAAIEITRVDCSLKAETPKTTEKGVSQSYASKMGGSDSKKGEESISADDMKIAGVIETPVDNVHDDEGSHDKHKDFKQDIDNAPSENNLPVVDGSVDQRNIQSSESVAAVQNAPVQPYIIEKHPDAGGVADALLSSQSITITDAHTYKDRNSLASLCLLEVHDGGSAKTSISVPELGDVVAPNKYIFIRRKLGEYTDRAEDLAVIARIFLLAKVMCYRELLRSKLTELTRELEEANESKENLDFKKLTEQYFRIKYSENAKNEETRGDGPRKKTSRRWQEWRLWCEDLLAKSLSSHSKHESVWTGWFAVLTFVTFLGWIWASKSGLLIASYLGWTCVAFVVPFSIAFMAIALHPQTLKDQIDYLLHEETDKALSDILSGLTQSAVSVAALNVDAPRGLRPLPESVLREMDHALQVKEAVSSLEKVIQARKKNVASSVSHIRDAQYRASRAATAAAGGVFTGFFTFEVGESVLKYMHLVGKHDDRSMFFWFASEAGPKSNMGKNETHTVSEPSNLKKYFEGHYLDPEVTAYAGLLTLTLVVSLGAAWIGWRKPKEEQAGGHGGHH